MAEDNEHRLWSLFGIIPGYWLHAIKDGILMVLAVALVGALFGAIDFHPLSGFWVKQPVQVGTLVGGIFTVFMTAVRWVAGANIKEHMATRKMLMEHMAEEENLRHEERADINRRFDEQRDLIMTLYRNGGSR